MAIAQAPLIPQVWMVSIFIDQIKRHLKFHLPSLHPQELNMSPEKGSFQKENHLPTGICLGIC